MGRPLPQDDRTGGRESMRKAPHVRVSRRLSGLSRELSSTAIWSCVEAELLCGLMVWTRRLRADLNLAPVIALGWLECPGRHHLGRTGGVAQRMNIRRIRPDRATGGLLLPGGATHKGSARVREPSKGQFVGIISPGMQVNNTILRRSHFESAAFDDVH